VVYRAGIEDIADLEGLGRKMPWTMAAFTAAALSMIGVPLTVGFVSKWYLCVGALEAGRWYVVPVVLVSSLLTVVYFWRLIERIYFGKAAGDDAANESGKAAKGREAPATMVVPTVVLAGLCVVLGMAAMLPARVAFKAADMLLGGGG
jgi:multicomponent Na+:H+ antiporter subunit D